MNIDQVAKRLDLSVRTVRRYIKIGKFSKPPKIKGKYVFNETFISQALPIIGKAKVANGQSKKETPNEQIERLARENGQLLLLKDVNVSLENALKIVNENYTKIEAEKKYLDLKLTEKEKALKTVKSYFEKEMEERKKIEAELQRSKNRNWFKRLFDM